MSRKRQVPDFESLLPELDLIGDDDLRVKVLAMWRHLWEEGAWERVTDVPVSAHIPTSQILHTRAVTRIALAVADIIQDVHDVRVDRDLLITAALVQDAAKIVEYEPGEKGGARRTERGEQMGHGGYGAVVASNVGLPIEVINVILSHSPGATVEMATLEAKILAYADQADVAALGGDRFIRKVVRYR